jgi:crotonobetainyl-CoA:carnitine CoA-transferase CaiB-like acyl-CoA transferase
MSQGMLAGVRVVDLTSVVIGPLCTQILADHGADIIKVESPEGDIGRHLGGRGRNPGMAPKFLHLNRNKRSICIDLKHPRGYEALLRLIEKADVMTWNNRPASMARLKLSYEDVYKINPRIIYCGMYGFGQRGRYAAAPAYDPIIQSVGGIAGLYEKAFGEPRYVPYVVADRTGGLIAVQMIGMALYHRERTGNGQSIGVPMFENVATQVLTEHLYNQTYDPPIGEAGDPRILNEFHAPAKTSDGYVSMSPNTDAQVFPLFDAMGLAHLKTDPRFSTVAARFKNVHEYYGLRAEGLKKKSTAFWLELCEKHDIPAAPYHTLETLPNDPHLTDVGFLQRREHPTEGTIFDINPANELSGGARKDWLPAPRLGEHTEVILREAGYSSTEITAMLSEGIAKVPPA